MANSSGTTHIVGPLAEEQARSGCEVSVYCVEKGPAPPALPDSALVKSRCFRRTLPLDNPGVSVGFARALRQTVDTFDVVHVHAIWNFPSWWTMRSARRANVPYIVAPQGSLDPWALQQNPWGKRLYGSLTEVPLLRRAACMQAVTEREAGQFQVFGVRAPCAVIPNGIDECLLEREYAPNPAYFGFSKDCRTLLFLSRVHPKKGLELLVRAAGIAREMNPELRIVVAGGDAGSGYLETIRTECARRGLGDMFLFLGEVKGDRKLEVLSAADAFILPSYSEGLPVAALEALGSGLPVVVTGECNLPEVLDRQAGHVVPPDAARIAGALEQLFSLSKAQRSTMGEAGRRLAAGKFTWRRIAERTLTCYRQLVDAGRVH